MLTEKQFGCNVFWWEQLHTEDQMKACADCVAEVGYRYIEFKRASFLQDDIAGEFKKAVKAAEAAGLRVSNFVVLRDLVSGGQKAIDDMIGTLAACAETGVKVLNNTFGGLPRPHAAAPEDWWMPAQANHQEGWDKLSEVLEKICAAADRYGVDLAMEPAVGSLVCDFYSLQELFNRFDHPRLGITMDPSHFLLHRNDIPYAIRRLGGKIKHVHMKDAVGMPGVLGLDFTFPTLGSGGIDWKAFLAALDAIGYKGALSGEYEQFKYMAHVRGNDPAYTAKMMFEEMTALYALYRG